jgi:hypothetical protein
VHYTKSANIRHSEFSNCRELCRKYWEAKVPKYVESAVSGPIENVIKNMSEMDWVSYITGMDSRLVGSYSPV